MFGANIGTTGTGWLVALIGVRVSLTAAALPMIFVGALVKLLGSGRFAGAGAALADAFGILRVVFVGLALLTLTLWAFFWMEQNGASDALARVVAVNALVIGQIFYLLNSRYEIGSSLSLKAHLDNKYLPLGIGAVVILQLLFTYATTAGPLRNCSHSTPHLALALVRRLRVLFRGRSGEADHPANAFAGRHGCLRPSPLTLNGIG